MVFYRQEKKRLYSFLNILRKTHEIIAPVKQDVVRFVQLKEGDEIHFTHNSYAPIKEYFFKKEEVLFTFTDEGFQQATLSAPQRVFFGVRRCDLNAVKHQDMVFM